MKWKIVLVSILLLFLLIIWFKREQLQIYLAAWQEYNSPKHYLPHTTFALSTDRASSPSSTLSPRIPRKLHQIYIHRTGKMNVELLETCEINRNMNPEFEYHVYSSDDIQRILTEFAPDIKPLYDSLIPPAFKADLFRYLILYKEGGVYMDCKSSTIRPLRDFIPDNVGFVCFRDILPGCIQNGFLASTPGHPLIKGILDQACANIRKRFYGKYTFDITGPSMCGRVFHQLLGHKIIDSPIDLGYYPQLDTFILGSLKFVGPSKFEALMNAKNEPLVKRTYSSYYGKSILDLDSYPIRWLTGRVYH